MSNSNSNSGKQNDVDEYEVTIWYAETYKVRAGSAKTAERIVKFKLENNKKRFSIPPFIHSIIKLVKKEEDESTRSN
jgi:hypothetical protein